MAIKIKIKSNKKPTKIKATIPKGFRLKSNLKRKRKPKPIYVKKKKKMA